MKNCPFTKTILSVIALCLCLSLGLDTSISAAQTELSSVGLMTYDGSEPISYSDGKNQYSSVTSHTVGDYTYLERSDGTAMIITYAGKAKDITLPDNLDGRAVTAVGSLYMTCRDEEDEDGGGFYRGSNSLTSVTIPSGITYIAPDAFEGQLSLQSIKVAKDNPTYVVKDGVLYLKSMTELVRYPAGKKDKSFAVPSTVKTIGAKAFASNQLLSSITLPSGLSKIGAYAFYGCHSLRGCVIPSGVTAMGDYAFFGCDNLPKITVPGSIKTIGAYAFACCMELRTVVLQSGVRSIGAHAFDGCEYLTDLTVPASVKSIDRYAIFADRDVFVIHTTKGVAAEDYAVAVGYRCRYPDGGSPAPELLSANAVKNGVKITWTAYPKTAKYRVFAIEDGKYRKLGDTKSASFVDTTIRYGNARIYTVRAIGSDGAYCSKFYKTGIEAVREKTPRLISVTYQNGYPLISWSGDCSNYAVFVKDGTKWKHLAYDYSGRYLDKTAKPGRTYTYTVRGRVDILSAYSSWYDEKGVSFAYLAAPSITKHQSAKSGLTLTWNKVKGAAFYRVYIKTDQGWKGVARTNAASYTVKGLKSGQKYTFTVRAVDRDGNLAYTYDKKGKTILYRP